MIVSRQIDNANPIPIPRPTPPRRKNRKTKTNSQQIPHKLTINLERRQNRLFPRQNRLCQCRGKHLYQCPITGNGSGKITHLVYRTDGVFYALTVLELSSKGVALFYRGSMLLG